MNGDQDLDLAARRLHELLDTSPTEALRKARQLPEHDIHWRLLRASILCDAGAGAGNIAAVEEASAIFAEALEREPDDASLNYNLANALVSQASLDSTDRPDWYLETADIRRRSRARYFRAARSKRNTNQSLVTQALTNLANQLDHAHRWIEAYESYQDALVILPENGSASGNAAITLFRAARHQVFGHEPHMFNVARRLAHHAQMNEETVRAFAGPQAVEIFRTLPSDASDVDNTTDDIEMHPYERFVASNRLFLSPILEGPGHDRKRWDDAHILQLTEAADTGPEVPPVVAMFNVAKADYLVARRLLYQALHDAPHETGWYLDTLDYAVYGEAPARLVLAQRAALDILDKIAVALNEHFQVGLSATKVDFRNLWRPKEKPHWRSRWREVIDRGNPAVIALSEIATDLMATQKGGDPDEVGILAQETAARNAGTHRFTVLHDMAPGRYRQSNAIEHYRLEAFQGIALRTLKLARAALLHFLEAIAYDDEDKGQGGHVRLPIPLVSHDWIRGQKDFCPLAERSTPLPATPSLATAHDIDHRMGGRLALRGTESQFDVRSHFC